MCARIHSCAVFSATDNRAVVSRKAQISGKTQLPSLEGNTLVPSSQKLQDASQNLKVANDISKTNLKNLSKYVECPAGKYLPAGGSSADACKDCREDHACAGSDRLMPNASMDQGIIKCATGKKPNSAKTACVIGTGIKVTEIDKKRKDDIIAKKDGKEISDKSGDVKCAAGQYLPGGKKECRVCEGTNKYCPGGWMDFANKDQGIYSCPTGFSVNSARSGCKITLAKDRLNYGVVGDKVELKKQCWTMKSMDDFITCVLGEADIKE